MTAPVPAVAPTLLSRVTSSRVVPRTPVGAAAVAGALVTIIMSLLTLWPPWGKVQTGVQTSVQAALTLVITYLAGWLNVVKAPGQSVQMDLTASALPTLEASEGTGEGQAAA